jgi:hypothetical protein
MRAAPVLLGAALLAASPARAEPIHGRAQLQGVIAFDRTGSLAAELDAKSRGDVLGDLRLSWSPRAGDWSFDAAYVVSFDAGETPQLTRAENALLPPPPPATWLGLTDSLADSRKFTAIQRIDRLSITYTSESLVLRAGRQALSWGAGLVFHPMDLVDPFAPDATDIEYKPGADMLYAQVLFADGSDLQGVIVPRTAHPGGPLEADASSFALHGRTSIGRVGATALVARDHGDITAGLALDGPLGRASWSVELVPTFVRDGSTHVSLLANISNAGKLWGHDVNYFAEYYHNGFGVNGSGATLAGLPAPLADRLQRGQLFDAGRDYLALGAQVQWTPLLTVNPTAISNLGDGSLYLLAEASWSLGDNLALNLGGQLPVGSSGSEFGGIPLSPADPATLGPPARLYLQLRRYF